MFERKRLYPGNINDYTGLKMPQPKIISGIPALVQNDYGDDNDCTLTAITTCIKYFYPKIDTYTIYNKVAKSGKKFGYTGSYGTPNATIKLIYNEVLRGMGSNKRACSRYFKEVGFSWNFIKKEIDAKDPILLNLWKDGRYFYQNHSVLIVGYLEYQGKRFLAIYDNWYRSLSYIDYQKLNPICSIHFLN